MKLILILPYEDYDLYEKYDHILIKKNKTIIKNLKLIEDNIFFENMIDNGGRVFIEKWEKNNGNRCHIVCGEHGAKLKPIHVISNTNDKKALFQTEYNIVITINIVESLIKIYENKIIYNKIIGKLINNFTFDYFFNNDNKKFLYSDVIHDVVSKMSDETFNHKNPLYAEGY